MYLYLGLIKIKLLSIYKVAMEGVFFNGLKFIGRCVFLYWSIYGNSRIRYL